MTAITQTVRGIKPILGNLGEQLSFESAEQVDRIKAWEIRVDDGYVLQPGYSGSPVVDLKTNNVLGIVSVRIGEGKAGYAISAEAVKKIWARVPFKQQLPTKETVSTSEKSKETVEKRSAIIPAKEAVSTSEKPKETVEKRSAIIPENPKETVKKNISRQFVSRTFDALPDSADFRDKLFEPSVLEVPPSIGLDEYLNLRVPVLDQGSEGACTGFGLATVANYLLRRRGIDPDPTSVSPRMFYEMAKRYDDWPGEEFEGTCARSTLKGWHRHGICAETLWPYIPGNNDRFLTPERTQDAVRRPLGAYYRVNPKDLFAMQIALAEAGILYATAIVHAGWWRHPTDKGWIEPDDRALGGHAFAIVAYDENGFWVQNSWGLEWGNEGLALITYDDWLTYGMDVWVVQLASPINLRTPGATARIYSVSVAAGRSQVYTFADLRPHIVSVGSSGELRGSGTYGTSPENVQVIFERDFPTHTQNWSKKRLLLYADGGLVSEGNVIQRVADYRPIFLQNQIYPLVINWNTDYWAILNNILEDALRHRRFEGPFSASKEFLLDRLDDAIEPLVRNLNGKTHWDRMKERGILSIKNKQGAGQILLKFLAQLLGKEPQIEVHVVAHSAGTIFLAPLIQLLVTSGKVTSGPLQGKTGYGLKIASCTLLAPAITMKLFKKMYLSAIQDGSIKQFTLYTLTDNAEQKDHCANIYHKSLLFLTSNALENSFRIPLIRPDGEPILGMERFVHFDSEIKLLFSEQSSWILAPNDFPEESLGASRCQHHGEFDTDSVTLRSIVTRIVRS